MFRTVNCILALAAASEDGLRGRILDEDTSSTTATTTTTTANDEDTSTTTAATIANGTDSDAVPVPGAADAEGLALNSADGEATASTTASTTESGEGQSQALEAGPPPANLETPASAVNDPVPAAEDDNSTLCVNVQNGNGTDDAGVTYTYDPSSEKQTECKNSPGYALVAFTEGGCPAVLKEIMQNQEESPLSERLSLDSTGTQVCLKDGTSCCVGLVTAMVKALNLQAPAKASAGSELLANEHSQDSATETEQLTNSMGQDGETDPAEEGESPEEEDNDDGKETTDTDTTTASSTSSEESTDTTTASTTVDQSA